MSLLQNFATSCLQYRTMQNSTKSTAEIPYGKLSFKENLNFKSNTTLEFFPLFSRVIS